MTTKANMGKEARAILLSPHSLPLTEAARDKCVNWGFKVTGITRNETNCRVGK